MGCGKRGAREAPPTANGTGTLQRRGVLHHSDQLGLAVVHQRVGDAAPPGSREQAARRGTREPGAGRHEGESFGEAESEQADEG